LPDFQHSHIVLAKTISYFPRGKPSVKIVHPTELLFFKQALVTALKRSIIDFKLPDQLRVIG
jgi:hypothetical protein